MANPTTNYGFVLPTPSDLVTDLPADFDVALQGVDTRLKALQPGTTTGDLAYSSATANTNTRLALGTAGQVLTVNSGATAPEWKTPAGGKVLQVVSSSYGVQVSNSTSTYADTGLTATITPSATSSKILVLVSQNGLFKSSNSSNNACNIKLFRGATQLAFAYSTFLDQIAQTIFHPGISFNYLDSPNTTSATTYKTQFANDVNGASVRVQHSSQNDSQITLLEIGA